MAISRLRPIRRPPLRLAPFDHVPPRRSHQRRQHRIQALLRVQSLGPAAFSPADRDPRSHHVAGFPQMKVWRRSWKLQLLQVPQREMEDTLPYPKKNAKSGGVFTVQYVKRPVAMETARWNHTTSRLVHLDSVWHSPSAKKGEIEAQNCGSPLPGEVARDAG